MSRMKASYLRDVEAYDDNLFDCSETHARTKCSLLIICVVNAVDHLFPEAKSLSPLLTTPYLDDNYWSWV